MCIRFLIEQYVTAKRRTAKRAGVRTLASVGGWMFEEHHDKWE